MVDKGEIYMELETQIQDVINTLRSEHQNPPELQDTANQLLVDAGRLDEYVSSHDFSGFRKVLTEMKQEAWKARTFATLRPDLSKNTRRNLEYVLYSIEALWNKSGLN